MITFVSTKHVKKKRDWGRCYRKAGFVHVGETKGGLIALQLSQDAIFDLRQTHYCFDLV